jgi:hypothetical protein
MENKNTEVEVLERLISEENEKRAAVLAYVKSLVEKDKGIIPDSEGT